MSIIHKIKTSIGIIRLFKNWPTFFLHYFNLKRNKEIVFRFRNGLKWHVDTTKRGFAVISDVWIQKPYKLLFEVNNPKIILDFGAHIGSFSIMAAKKYPNSKIYAFEASNENFLNLQKNIKINNIKNIRTFNIGISDKNAILRFFINEKNTILNTFINTAQFNNSKNYKVRCKKLSTLFNELKIKHCDFLKLDVEGFEYRILKSSEKNGVLKNIGALTAEIDVTSSNFKKTTALLNRNGFATSINGDIINAKNERRIKP
ncbi:MAG: FkbM family methyltransferase [Nanoarchaeota archaeon]